MKQSMWLVVILLGAPAAAAQLPPVPREPDAQAKTGPCLHVADRLRDLGTILEGDKPKVQWLLQNRGTSDLVITATRSSCGCAVVQLTEEQKVIPPGEVLELVVEFDSKGRRDAQDKSITVLTNDPAEPELKLSFKAVVEFLYEIQPGGLVNLRGVRRGETVPRTIDIYPGSGRKSVNVLEVKVPDFSPLSFRAESFEARGGTGQQLHMTVSPDVSLGTLNVEATLKLSIDGIERERNVSIRGEVVGDLTWHPRVIDATRQPSLPGKQLAPITIQSTNDVRFEILGATAGPYFDVTFEPVKKGSQGSEYTVFLTLRDEVPVGPFGAMLDVRTDSLDQPLVPVPVFGIVPPPVEVEPPMILLRQDGTPAGTQRRIKIQAQPQQTLDVSDIKSDNAALTAAIDRESSSRYQHLRYIIVTLRDRLPKGVHQAVLTLTTNVPGAERLEIPVRIDVADGAGR